MTRRGPSGRYSIQGRQLAVVARLLVVSALIAGVVGCGASRPAGRAPTPAAPVVAGIDLTGWKLTLPEENEDGNADEVEPAALTQPWLPEHPSGDGLEFWAPASGATTKNSKHPRTELISLTRFRAGTGTHTLRASVTPSQVPRDGQGIILGQIHGADELSSVPYVMLRYQGDQVKVVVKSARKGDERTTYPLLENVPLNSRFDFALADVGNGDMIFSGSCQGRSREVRAPVPAPFRDATVRFQAGSYQQSDDPQGDDDGGRVVFHELAESTGRP